MSLGVLAAILALGGAQTSTSGAPDAGTRARVRTLERRSPPVDASTIVVVPLTSSAEGGGSRDAGVGGPRGRRRRDAGLRSGSSSTRRRSAPPRSRRRSSTAPRSPPSEAVGPPTPAAAGPSTAAPAATGPGARLRAAAPELGKKIIEQVDEVRRLSPFGRLGLALLVAALLILLGRVLERLEGWFAPTGLLPRFLRLTGRLTGAAAALFVAWGLVAFIPAVAPEVRWAALGAAAAVAAFAAWSFLPDLFATAVLALERRVTPGVRLSGPDFAGTVKRVSWRSTVLRSPRGEVAVPNRRLLAAPVQMSRTDEHELVITLDDARPVQDLRRMIEDAVLASAFTPPEPGVRVWRDPRDARRWVIHARLLHPRFAPVFDADLPERLEAALRDVVPARS